MKYAIPVESTGAVISEGIEKVKLVFPKAFEVVSTKPALSVNVTAVVLDASTKNDTVALAAFHDLGT